MVKGMDDRAIDGFRLPGTFMIVLVALMMSPELGRSQTYVDRFSEGKSELGFTARQPDVAPEALEVVTVDDPAWGYNGNPIENNPSGDSSVLRVGNLQGEHWGVAEATLLNNEIADFEELRDVRIEAWVYCLAGDSLLPDSPVRARVGLYVRDSSDDILDSFGNGAESFPPQVHYDSSPYAGPGFGTSGFASAIKTPDDELVPPEGAEGYVLATNGDGELERTNDLFNRSVLTENRWIKMFAEVRGNSLTVGVDWNGDGVYEPGEPGQSETAFYPDIRNYDAEGNIVDPNDVGRVGCFAVVTSLHDPVGIPDAPAFFDDVTITVQTAVTDWCLF